MNKKNQCAAAAVMRQEVDSIVWLRTVFPRFAFSDALFSGFVNAWFLLFFRDMTWL